MADPEVAKGKENSSGDPAGFSINEFLRTVLAQVGGDKDAAMRKLGRDAQRARARAREAELKISEVEKKLPTDGSIVLNGDDAKEYTEFKKLGRKTAEITTDLNKLGGLEARVTGMEREKDCTKVCDLLGYKHPPVLLDQLNGRKMDLTFRKAKVKDEEGKDVEQDNVPCVRAQGDEKAPWTPVQEWVEKDLKLYLPALLGTSESDSDSGERFVPVAGVGTSRTTPSGRARGSSEVVTSYLASRYAVPGAKDAGTKK
jgi:hypothetical protein